jgi:hypothetical protein
VSKKKLSVTYSRVTPESASEGDFSETGHREDIPVEVDEYDREEGTTAVDIVVKALRDAGATNPSSSMFHRGVWYSTEFETVSYRTGEEEERSFHLKGFTEAEEREIYSQVTRRRR